MKIFISTPKAPLWVLLCLSVILAGCGPGKAPEKSPDKVNIVAAENFYGGVARQIAGNAANITSILNDPNQDPHEFTTDAATAKAVADADIVIYNGIGYDDWMEKLLGVQGKPGRIVIRVAGLIGAKAGDNPHIWYNPRTMPALAAQLAGILNQPGNLAAFQKEMDQVTATIEKITIASRGVPVTATEPVYGWMAAALGFQMENEGFQLAVMNDTEPSFQQTADFEKSLGEKSVKILFYNRQVTDPTTARMLAFAEKSGVPVVGVTETQPPTAKDYADWILTELDEVNAALKGSH
jgi:zinc/manganese transport system substrate-binding protein